MKKKTGTRDEQINAMAEKCIAAMRKETISAISKGGRRQPEFSRQEILDLAGVPPEFGVRWSLNRAVTDIVSRGREVGLVASRGGNRVVYQGPDVEKAKKVKKAGEKKRDRELAAALRGLGFKHRYDYGRQSVPVDKDSVIACWERVKKSRKKRS